MATTQTQAKNKWSSIAYLKLLTFVVFVSMAIISLTAVMSYRASKDAGANSKTNSRTLELVEQCVVDGECGPQTGEAGDGTIRIVNYMIDAVGCILLVEPPARQPADIERCKLETAPKAPTAPSSPPVPPGGRQIP